ncbi:hypothetical protein Cgig2_033615 [Carnegiea gigantea]|uniref:RNase H type-1 domain-containing protein n=1 Tax=Carnegiea gigantea TaxID=171969 RepID=A0A9Q1QMJ9_9CARY|nr:hypothetical protein Cgig2_033615 [Carnegiea gigantea]
MWECWNARNRFIFKDPDHNLSSLGKKAIDFVHSYRYTFDSKSSPQPTAHKSTWSPPTPGCLKINLIVLRNDVLLDGAKHGFSSSAPIIEEAWSCLHALKSFFVFGARHMIVEGDCLPLINMLKTHQIHDMYVGFLVRDIVSFTKNFDFVSWSFVKRGVIG